MRKSARGAAATVTARPSSSHRATMNCATTNRPRYQTNREKKRGSTYGARSLLPPATAPNMVGKPLDLAISALLARSITEGTQMRGKNRRGKNRRARSKWARTFSAVAICTFAFAAETLSGEGR